VFNNIISSRATFDGCDARRAITSVVVVKQTIHIIADVLRDTTLEINSDLTVTVDNAPTELDLITTFYSKSTDTQTIHEYVVRPTNSHATFDTADRKPTTAASTYVRKTFLLVISAFDLSEKRRRQSGPFVGYNGRATSAWTQASTLTLQNGQLFLTYANGTVAQFSASSNNAYDYFLPSVNPGNITTTFSLSNTGTLLWNNVNFYNDAGPFCVLPSGQILAVFQQNTQPASCVFIDLTVAELTSCAATSLGTVLVGGAQGPTGPSGASGPSGPTGPSGLSGLYGAVSATGATGPSGLSGLSGLSGPSGTIGLSGPSGASGLQGIQGSQGPSGLSGLSGPSGPSGTIGLPGLLGPSGPSGVIGPSGPSGPSGAFGATGATGAMGPSGSPGIAYAYLGCFYQSGNSSSTSNKVLVGGFIATYTTGGNVNCSSQCNNRNNIILWRDQCGGCKR